MYDLGARGHDPARIPFGSIDPRAEDYYSQSPYAFAANNPVYYVDINGEGVDWKPSIKNGNIVLKAEEGDNSETLIAFFGDKKNALNYVSENSISEGKSYSEGSEVSFNGSNVFSKTLKYYTDNIEKFTKKKAYDCKEFVRQTVINIDPIESTEGTDTSPLGLAKYGKDINRVKKIKKSEHKIGDTFIMWSYTPPIGDHGAAFMGKSKDGTMYYFSKNGTKGPLTIGTEKQLEKTYNLWDTFRTDYKATKYRGDRTYRD